MKIVVTIEGESRFYSREIDPWISRSIGNGRRPIVIEVEADQVNLFFASPRVVEEQRKDLVERRHSLKEREICQIWTRLGLSQDEPRADSILAFLHHLKS
ncbi:hypothetical protein [Luteolibacter soli]|uniref:Uncharacterized protein n=1 Tax=Luteolibacter soli TaxID=3135280 RepID=A0ABU9B3E1_9BACT